jgi:hypothetical protein
MSVKLLNWVRQQIVIEREVSEGPCVKLVLKHININSKQNEIALFDLRAMRAGAENQDAFFDSLVNEIETRAHDDAEGLGGTQRYCVFAHCKNADKPVSRFTFRMEAGDQDGDDDGEAMSEPPTKTGMVGQLMRHTEAIMRTSVVSTNHTISMLQRTIDRQAEQIEKLLSEKFRNLETMEDLISRRDERKLAAADQVFKHQLQGETFKRLMMLAPVVVNRMAGKTLIPGANPMNQMLANFAGSLKTEQMEQMAQILTPEQMITVIEVIKSVTPEDPPETEETQANGSTHHQPA